MMFAVFLGEDEPFQRVNRFEKSSLGGATIGAPMRENSQNLRKWVQSLCAPFRPFRSELKEKFYHGLSSNIL